MEKPTCKGRTKAVKKKFIEAEQPPSVQSRAKQGRLKSEFGLGPSLARILIILIVLSGPLYAESDPPLMQQILSGVPEADREVLVNDGELIRFQHGGFSATLMPNIGLGRLVAASLQNQKFSLGLEGLFFMPVSDLPNTWTSVPERERTLILYNILRSVSTLTGLEYYSASRKKMRLLFEESWVIANPKIPGEPLADPVLEALPEGPVFINDTMFIHQKDKSFASNESRMLSRARKDALSTTIINLTPLRYWGVFRIVQPEAMQTHLLAVPLQEGLLVYGVIAAETVDSKMFMAKAEASFTNRVKALAGWYMDRLREEF